MQIQTDSPQLSKATGEGSHGGKILGHTKSGKPIYAHSHASYVGLHASTKGPGFLHPNRAPGAARKAHPNYTADDHRDAATAHEKHWATSGIRGDEGMAMSRVADAHHRAWSRGLKKSQLHGEGSHGGHVIGHTRSGKAIYSHDHEANASLHPKGVEGWLPRKQAAKIAESAHPSFSAHDHIDAMEAHNDAYRKAGPGPHSMAIQRLSDAHAKAFDHLSRKEVKPTKLEKAAHHGEGARGGHIIGHTRSGKPIYSLLHDMNHIKGGRLAIAASHHLIGYTPDDFADAAARHMEKFTQHREKMPRRAQKHLKLARHLAHTATEKGVEGDKMQMSGLHSSHGNHASLAAFHLREAEAKRGDDPSEALWHYGQVGLHSSAAMAAHDRSVS